MIERRFADVTIIGGGVAGCAAAVALRRAGMSVVLLEKGMCGAGASGVNFGGVRQQGRNLAELPLARRSRAIWDKLNEMLGEDVEFEATGHIKLARSEADMAELEGYARDAAEYGLRLQMLGANAAARRAALARREGGRRIAVRGGRRRQSAPRRPGLRPPRPPPRGGCARAFACHRGRTRWRALRDPHRGADGREPLPRQHRRNRAPARLPHGSRRMCRSSRSCPTCS